MFSNFPNLDFLTGTSLYCFIFFGGRSNIFPEYTHPPFMHRKSHKVSCKLKKVLTCFYCSLCFMAVAIQFTTLFIPIRLVKLTKCSAESTLVRMDAESSIYLPTCLRFLSPPLKKLLILPRSILLFLSPSQKGEK